MRSTKKGILILGMHRSGTSVVGRLASAAGIALGEDLFPAQKGVNERGFWENAAAVRINEDLLLGVGSWWDDWLPLPPSWDRTPPAETAVRRVTRFIDDIAAGVPVWGVKDPRMCRLVDVWRRGAMEADSELAYLIPLRHPSEVTASLRNRDGFSEAKACALWLRHVLDTERGTRGQARGFCTFDAVLGNPGLLLDLFRTLMPDEDLASEEQFLACAGDFVSAELRHHATDNPAPSSELACICQEAYGLLASGNMSDIDASHYADIDRLSERFEAALKASPALYEEQLRSLGEARARYHKLWRELPGLWSWKLTAPLRHLERRIKGHAG